MLPKLTGTLVKRPIRGPKLGKARGKERRELRQEKFHLKGVIPLSWV